MNANIMKKHFFPKIIYDLKSHFHVMEKLCFFILWPSDLIKILTFLWTNFILVLFLMGLKRKSLSNMTLYHYQLWIFLTLVLSYLSHRIWELASIVGKRRGYDKSIAYGMHNSKQYNIYFWLRFGLANVIIIKG